MGYSSSPILQDLGAIDLTLILNSFKKVAFVSFAILIFFNRKKKQIFLMSFKFRLKLSQLF